MRFSSTRLSSMPTNLLLVDNDFPSRDLLAAELASHGFDIACAAGAAEMRERLCSGRVDFVLLAIDPPGNDDLTLVRELRRESEVGIIILTARDGQTDRVACLEWGADDHVTRQTPLVELVARIRAVLRRIRPPLVAGDPVIAVAGGEVILFERWALNLNSFCLISPVGEEIKLTRGEFSLLAVLARNLGKAVSRTELLAALSSREWSGAERSVDVLIGRLRRKLGDDPRRPRRLMTVHGTGYRLVG